MPESNPRSSFITAVDVRFNALQCIKTLNQVCVPSPRPIMEYPSKAPSPRPIMEYPSKAPSPRPIMEYPIYHPSRVDISNVSCKTCNSSMK